MYIENPKTKGSGIVCAIPQKGRCPNNCGDCFFQSGRSFLEPLSDNLPNMPGFLESWSLAYGDRIDKVVRVNDGNDSNHQRDLVIEATKDYPMKFYNTCDDYDLEGFPGPVVLTVNPGTRTVKGSITYSTAKNLMFVRVRVNTWNLELVDEAVKWYSEQGVAIVLTFMAYFDSEIPENCRRHYAFKKRTLNSYWVITPSAWDNVVARYRRNKYVYTCGKSADEHACKHCGNCLREYYSTVERSQWC